MADQDEDEKSESEEKFSNTPKIRGAKEEGEEHEPDKLGDESHPESESTTAKEAETKAEPEVESAPKARVRKKSKPAKKKKASKAAPYEKKEKADTFCVSISKRSGGIVRKLHEVKESVGAVFVNAASICRETALRRERRRLQSQRDELFIRLGSEVSQLAKEKISDVFGRETVEELISEIRGIEVLIEETEEGPGPVVASRLDEENN